MRLVVDVETPRADAARSLTDAPHKFSQVLPNVLISGGGGLFQAQEIGSIVTTPAAESVDLLLERCGDVGEGDDLSGDVVETVDAPRDGVRHRAVGDVAEDRLSGAKGRLRGHALQGHHGR